MCKLDFEWHDSRRGGEYRAEAGGFIVKAIRAAILEGFPL